MRIGHFIRIEATLTIDMGSSVLVAFPWFVFFVGAYPSAVYFLGTDRRRRLGLGEADAIWGSTFWDRNILLIKRKLGRKRLGERWHTR